MLKQIGIVIRAFVLLVLLLLCSNFAYAQAPATMADSVAMGKARVSFVMHDANGDIYNLYIIGENESFVGAGNSSWCATETDQVYEASWYDAYLTGPNSRIAVIQDVSLFGYSKNEQYKQYINLTAPSYRSGVYLIKGVNGQPDILATAMQMTASFVDYRFFAIKNGELTPMKLMFSNQRTGTRMVGIHKRAYGLDDGTIAIPWVRQGMKGMTGGLKSGRFISVFMPDFTNMILIFSYSIED